MLFKKGYYISAQTYQVSYDCVRVHSNAKQWTRAFPVTNKNIDVGYVSIHL